VPYCRSKNCENVCTVLTACSIVRCRTAGVRIVKMCLQFLVLLVLNCTILQEQKLLKYVYSFNACSIVLYRTAGVKLGKTCIQVLRLAVFYGTVLQL
jgi:ribosomal protein L30E